LNIKRLRPYARWELIEGLEEKLDPRAGAAEVAIALEREGRRLLALLRADELVVALDRNGRQFGSEALADWLEQIMGSGCSRLSFIIGSANGLDSAVLRRADHSLALSALTFPHQLAVLVLAEQVYRGFRIIRGEPYHK